MKQQKKYTHGALSAPAYPDSLPPNCKWLGSEGYGVWFLLTIEKGLENNQYRIRRYKDDGTQDCDRIFELTKGQIFTIKEDFEFGYMSHCQECTVYQKGNKLQFTFLKEFNRSNVAHVTK